jgi:tetratricopeptide (TPR) repeat protein
MTAPATPLDSFQCAAAVRRTRMLLVKAGLTESEADAWLLRMRDEFARGNLQTEQDRALFCEFLIREITAGRDQGPGGLAPQWADVRAIVVNAIGSALGGALVLGARALFQANREETIERSLVTARAREALLSRWNVEWVHAPGGYDRSNTKNWEPIERLARRALQIVEHQHGFQDERTARHLTSVGRCLDAQKRYAEAEPFLERAFAIEKALHGLENPHTGIILINLGLHDFAQGRYAQAAGLFRQGLKAVESGRGPEDIDTAGALYNLGVVLDVQGYHAEAEPLLRRALAIAEKVAPAQPSGEDYVPLYRQYMLLVREQLRTNLAAQDRHAKTPSSAARRHYEGHRVSHPRPRDRPGTRSGPAGS